MTKSPAFQFYPNDFLGSPAVQAMSAEEIGMYMLLLCADWNGDGLQDDVKENAKICRVREKKFSQAWKRISRCFDLSPDGRYRNARLQREREKQLAYSQRMAENGKRGGRPKAAVKPQLSGKKAAVKPNESIPFPSPTPDSTTTTTTQRGTVVPTPDELHVLEHYLSQHPRRRYGEKDILLVRKRLREGLPAQTLCMAITGNKQDTWHRERRKHELSYVLRDAGKVSEFADRGQAMFDAAMSGRDYWDNPELQALTAPSRVA